MIATSHSAILAHSYWNAQEFDKVVVFDLDHTFLNIDSDKGWNTYLSQLGFAFGDTYLAQNEKYYAQYVKGELNILEYLHFSLQYFVGKNPHHLRYFLSTYGDYVQRCIRPSMLQSFAHHRQHKALCILATATHQILSLPIAIRNGFDVLLATTIPIDNGVYVLPTSNAPAPVFAEKKAEYLHEFLSTNRLQNLPVYAYSDSINDFALLKYATHSFAVAPDQQLRVQAQQHGWTIVDQ